MKNLLNYKILYYKFIILLQKKKNVFCVYNVKTFLITKTWKKLQTLMIKYFVRNHLVCLSIQMVMVEVIFGIMLHGNLSKPMVVIHARIAIYKIFNIKRNLYILKIID